jgi:serine protease Do
VVAIGNPFGLGGTATVGIVSARGRDIRSGPYDDYLQIDAPINKGNSGGPIFNTRGEVVGVNTAIYSPNGGSVGIGFAIPANQVQNIVAELKIDGAVDRGWLGVLLQDINEELAEGLGLESQKGVLIADVVDDSPAEHAGIEVGDIILGYDGQEILNARALSRIVGASDQDDRVTLEIHRGDEQIELEVTLGAADTQTALAGKEQELSDLGLALSPLTDELRDQLGVNTETSGAVIVNIDPQGTAAKRGLQRGDILVRADRKPINNPKDLKKVLQQAKKQGRSSVPVLVRRGDTQQFSTLPVA